MNEELKKYKVAWYCRKSQESEDKQVLSLPTQALESERLSNFYGITDYLIIQEAKSGKTPDKRPVFKKMMADIRSGKRNAIGCWKLDRLARNMKEGGEIIDLLQRGIIKVIITSQKIYWPSENALLMAVEFGSANQFSRDLSQSVKRGQEGKARKGVPHGLAALGFTNDKSEEKGNRKWLVDNVKYPLVKDLFKEFLTGTYSSGKLAKYARETLKLTTPKHKKIGGALVVPSRIHAMLRDPIHAGFFFYAGQRWELDKRLPRAITEAQHDKILRILAGKNIAKIKTHVTTFSGFVQSPIGEFIGQDIKSQLICDCKFKFAYSNKVNCPNCGQLIAELKKPKYLEYRYYYNVSRKKQGLRANMVEEGRLQSYLLKYVDENLHFSSALLAWSKKYLHELRDREIEKNMAVISQGNETINAAKKRKQKVIQLMADEQVSGEDGKATLEELNKIITSNGNHTAENEWFEKAMDITDLLAEFMEIMKSDDVQAKRAILTRLGSNLVWDEEEVSIINAKWIDVLISGLGAARTKNPQFEPRNIEDTTKRNEVFAAVHSTLLRR